MSYYLKSIPKFEISSPRYRALQPLCATFLKLPGLTDGEKGKRERENEKEAIRSRIKQSLAALKLPNRFQAAFSWVKCTPMHVGTIVTPRNDADLVARRPDKVLPSLGAPETRRFGAPFKGGSR